jgi:hypothetical protein
LRPLRELCALCDNILSTLQKKTNVAILTR